MFYFDTFGEGKKPEGDFVPSIGGRFSEGQLRTEPRTVVDETSRAMENLLLERNDGEDTESHVALEEDVAETTRRMLASKLTATPIPGFVDDGDDDDDDDSASRLDDDDEWGGSDVWGERASDDGERRERARNDGDQHRVGASSRARRARARVLL